MIDEMKLNIIEKLRKYNCSKNFFTKETLITIILLIVGNIYIYYHFNIKEISNNKYIELNLMKEQLHNISKETHEKNFTKAILPVNSISQKVEFKAFADSTIEIDIKILDNYIELIKEKMDDGKIQGYELMEIEKKLVEFFKNSKNQIDEIKNNLKK